MALENSDLGTRLAGGSKHMYGERDASTGSDKSPCQNDDYDNARFGFHLELPAGRFKALTAPENADGFRFVSSDGDADLAAWGSYDVSVLGLDARADMDRTIELNPGWDLKSKNLQPDSFELSGFDGNKAFYQKTILAGDESVNFLIEYDKSMKSTYEPMTRTISAQFKGPQGTP